MDIALLLARAIFGTPVLVYPTARGLVSAAVGQAASQTRQQVRVRFVDGGVPGVTGEEACRDRRFVIGSWRGANKGGPSMSRQNPAQMGCVLYRGMAQMGMVLWEDLGPVNGVSACAQNLPSSIGGRLIFEHRVGGAGASGSLTVGCLRARGGYRGRCTGVPSCPFFELTHPPRPVVRAAYVGPVPRRALASHTAFLADGARRGRKHPRE